MAHDVFISYASEDKSVADTICTALEAERIRCWISPRDIVPGRAYSGQITRAIEESHAMVLLFSSNSNVSEHVLRELQLAANARLKVLNFKIEDIAPNDDMQYFLSVPQWLDATTPPLEQHLAQLVTSLGALLEAARSPVAPTAVRKPETKRPGRTETGPHASRRNILLRSIFALACLVAIFVTYVSTDPFLIYYLASVLVIVGLYWATLKFNSGEMQIRAAKRSFMLVGALVTAAVLWRAMDVYFYVSASDRHSIPLGLYERHSYLPYFALLGIGLITIIWVIYANTQEPPNTENRSSILSYFIGSCVYLAVCRLAWELVDSIAKAKIASQQ